MEKIEPQTVAIGPRSKLYTAAADQAGTITSSSVVVSPSKKRKVDSRDSKSLPSSDDDDNNGHALSISPPKPASPIDCCDDFTTRRHGRFPQPVACSYDSCLDLKSEDLVASCFKRRDNTHTSISSQIDNVSSPESEVWVAATTEGEMESKSTASTQSRSMAYQTPTAEEIEEFFAAAEKNVAQRFARKYNYDVVNDMPLDGRFEWSQVKQ